MKNNGQARDSALLGEMLRAQRSALGIQQTELAARLGVNQAFVSKSERGQRRLEVVEWIMLCEALGVSAPEFLQRYLRRRAGLS